MIGDCDKGCYYCRTVTDQNYICDEVERRVDSGKVWSYAVQNTPPCHLISKQLKIRICIRVYSYISLAHYFGPSVQRKTYREHTTYEKEITGG